MSRTPGSDPFSGKRCFGDGDSLYSSYHDDEWGRPLREERLLFELLTLEVFQAGLSWKTILHRREGFRRAFQDFFPEKVAAFTPKDVDRLLADPGIIRHRAKIEATVANARATLALRNQGTGLVEFVWSFQPKVTPQRERWESVPASTPESTALAKELKRRGFHFLGPTSAYSLMQAAGLVNDHLMGCPVRPQGTGR